MFDFTYLCFANVPSLTMNGSVLFRACGDKHTRTFFFLSLMSFLTCLVVHDRQLFGLSSTKHVINGEVTKLSNDLFPKTILSRREVTTIVIYSSQINYSYHLTIMTYYNNT